MLSLQGNAEFDCAGEWHRCFFNPMMHAHESELQRRRSNTWRVRRRFERPTSQQMDGTTNSHQRSVNNDTTSIHPPTHMATTHHASMMAGDHRDGVCSVDDGPRHQLRRTGWGNSSAVEQAAFVRRIETTTKQKSSLQVSLIRPSLAASATPPPPLQQRGEE